MRNEREPPTPIEGREIPFYLSHFVTKFSNFYPNRGGGGVAMLDNIYKIESVQKVIYLIR